MKRWVANNKSDLLNLALCTKDTQVIISYNIYNPSLTSKVSFSLELWREDTFLATMMNTDIEPSDTLFIDTKIVMKAGDYLKVASQKDLHVIISGA